MPAETLTELDATSWELYHVAEDFAGNHNLTDQDRPRLIELIAQWYVEAAATRSCRSTVAASSVSPRTGR